MTWTTRTWRSIPRNLTEVQEAEGLGRRRRPVVDRHELVAAGDLEDGPSVGTPVTRSTVSFVLTESSK